MSITVRVTALLAAGLCALTACASGADDAPPRVVSFRTAPPADASPSPKAGPPTYRVDMTREEEDVLLAVYFQCLHDNGVPMAKQADGTWSWSGAESKMQSETPKIQKACDHTYPRQAPEMDPATNPYYEEDNDNYFQCLADHGDDVHRKADGEWELGPKWGDFPNAEAITEQCEQRAFNGKKG